MSSSVENVATVEVSSHTYLGFEFSFDLKWNRHIYNIFSQAEKRLNLLCPLKYKLDRKALETIYESLIRPLFINLEGNKIIFDAVFRYIEGSRRCK